jgi:hypothetical protein
MLLGRLLREAYGTGSRSRGEDLDGRRRRPHVSFVSPDDAEIAEVKTRLRSLGWYLRYTEWPTGHQVVIHRRSDTAVHLVTAWRASEEEAWREALSLALGEREDRHADANPG